MDVKMGNGAVSLGAALFPLFPSCGSHSAIQDVPRKVRFRPPLFPQGRRFHLARRDGAP